MDGHTIDVLTGKSDLAESVACSVCVEMADSVACSVCVEMADSVSASVCVEMFAVGGGAHGLSINLVAKFYASNFDLQMILQKDFV